MVSWSPDKRKEYTNKTVCSSTAWTSRFPPRTSPHHHHTLGFAFLTSIMDFLIFDEFSLVLRNISFSSKSPLKKKKAMRGHSENSLQACPIFLCSITGTLGPVTCQIQCPIVMGFDKQHHYLILMIDILCFPWWSTISSFGFFIKISLSKNQSPPKCQTYQSLGEDYGRLCQFNPKGVASFYGSFAYTCKSILVTKDFLP